MPRGLDHGALERDGERLGLLTRLGEHLPVRLKVRGDSMIDAHICDGDTVVLEKREPRNNDIVAALIDGETTLKRFIKEKGKTYLQAENPHFPDLIPVEELIVQGVMVALLRKAA